MEASTAISSTTGFWLDLFISVLAKDMIKEEQKTMVVF